MDNQLTSPLLASSSEAVNEPRERKPYVPMNLDPSRSDIPPVALWGDERAIPTRSVHNLNTEDVFRHGYFAGLREFLRKSGGSMPNNAHQIAWILPAHARNVPPEGPQVQASEAEMKLALLRWHHESKGNSKLVFLENNVHHLSDMRMAPDRSYMNRRYMYNGWWMNGKQQVMLTEVLRRIRDISAPRPQSYREDTPEMMAFKHNLNLKLWLARDEDHDFTQALKAALLETRKNDFVTPPRTQSEGARKASWDSAFPFLKDLEMKSPAQGFKLPLTDITENLIHSVG